MAMIQDRRSKYSQQLRELSGGRNLYNMIVLKQFVMISDDHYEDIHDDRVEFGAAGSGDGATGDDVGGGGDEEGQVSSDF